MYHGALPDGLSALDLSNAIKNKSHRDKLLYFYLSLYSKNKDSEGYANYHHSEIRAMFSYHLATKLLKKGGLLESEGLIEIKSHYFNPENPSNNINKRYRIPKHILGDGSYKKIILESKVAINCIEKYKLAKLDYMTTNIKVLALKEICKYQMKNIRINIPQLEDNFKESEINKTIYELNNPSNEPLFLIQDTGRFTTRWTNVPNRHINFIEMFYQGKYHKVSEVDIVASQPTLLSCLTRDLIAKYVTEEDLRKIDQLNIIFESKDFERFNSDATQIYEKMVYHYETKIGNDWKAKFDVRRREKYERKLKLYRENNKSNVEYRKKIQNDLILAENGLGYFKNGKRVNINKLNVELSKDVVKHDHPGEFEALVDMNDRRASKTMMISDIFFGATSDKSETQRLFKELYPDVADAIEKIKSIYLESNPWDKQYFTNLSFLLQSVEADFLNNHVIPFLSDQGFIEMITKYDGIIVPSCASDMCKDVFEECAMLMFNKKINVKIK